MAKTDEKVMALVEDELKKNPDIGVGELQAKAKSVNSAVGKLTARQFNARYPLQIKRRLKAAGARTRAKAPARKRAARRRAEPNREAIRDAFLRFATDLAAAEERKDLVQVLAGVDRYVDEVAKASGR